MTSRPNKKKKKASARLVARTYMEVIDGHVRKRSRRSSSSCSESIAARPSFPVQRSMQCVWHLLEKHARLADPQKISSEQFREGIAWIRIMITSQDDSKSDLSIFYLLSSSSLATAASCWSRYDTTRYDSGQDGKDVARERSLFVVRRRQFLFRFLRLVLLKIAQHANWPLIFDLTCNAMV